MKRWKIFRHHDADKLVEDVEQFTASIAAGGFSVQWLVSGTSVVAIVSYMGAA